MHIRRCKGVNDEYLFGFWQSVLPTLNERFLRTEKVQQVFYFGNVKAWYCLEWVRIRNSFGNFNRVCVFAFPWFPSQWDDLRGVSDSLDWQKIWSVLKTYSWWYSSLLIDNEYLIDALEVINDGMCFRATTRWWRSSRPVTYRRRCRIRSVALTWPLVRRMCCRDDWCMAKPTCSCATWWNAGTRCRDASARDCVCCTARVANARWWWACHTPATLSPATSVYGTRNPGGRALRTRIARPATPSACSNLLGIVDGPSTSSTAVAWARPRLGYRRLVRALVKALVNSNDNPRVCMCWTAEVILPSARPS